MSHRAERRFTKRFIDSRLRLCWLLILSLLFHGSLYGQEPAKQEVLATMKKATQFMVDKVAYRGGYVWSVSEDFSRRDGEVPARNTQIWIQGGRPMSPTFILMLTRRRVTRYFSRQLAKPLTL